jgi:hypothetical protein
MRATYRVLAIIIAVEVVVQASMMAFAVFGLTNWIEGGGVLDSATMEDRSAEFTGVLGFAVHSINGMMIIPLLAVVLLIVSFFTKLPGAVRAAVGLLVMVAIQVTLGIFGHESAYIGLLHGIVALLIFGAAIGAARIASRRAVEAELARTAPAPTTSGSTAIG